MKTVAQLLAYRPQIANVKDGKEPPLEEILFQYYKGSGMTWQQSVECTTCYVEALERAAQ